MPKLSADIEELYPKEVYKGDECLITLVIKKRIQFSCAFENVINYPFGDQICSFSFYIQGTSNSLTNLIPKKTINLGPSRLGQYFVRLVSGML